MSNRSAYRTTVFTMFIVAAFAGLSGAARADDACTQPQHAAVGAALAQSSFDGGADGWTIVENNNKGGPEAEGGHITGTDEKGHATWFWLAPNSYLGNRSSAYGGSLSFDQIQSQDGSQTSDARHVYLEGGGLAISIDKLGNPGTEWTHYVVLLHECANWKNAETGEPAKAEEIQRVLGALEKLYIRGEFRIGDDQSSLDNVVLHAGLPQAPAPDFAFTTSITPDPGVGGEETVFALEIKNNSTTRHLTDVTVDIVFTPSEHDPLRPQPMGSFKAVNAICDPLAGDNAQLASVPHADVAHGYRCDIGSLLTGDTHKLSFVQDDALPGNTAYRFAASSKETGVASLEAGETGRLGDNAGDGTITVVAGTIDLEISIPPLGLETRTGDRKDLVLTVTNKGNARHYQPALDIVFAGDAVPENLISFEVMAGRPEDPDSVEAPLEVCEVDAQTIRCLLVHESEFSEGEPYLAPGETRQITLAFTPLRAGPLTLTGRANGKDGFGDVATGEFSQETTVIGPHFALSLEKTTPDAYGTVSIPDGTQGNLHVGDDITLHYSIYNGPDHGAARDFGFDVIALDSRIKSITSPSGAHIWCDNKGDLATCVVDRLGSGETVTIDVALSSLEQPVYVSADIKGGGSTASHTYWIGADVDLFALEDFAPGNRTEVFPGEEITGGFMIGAIGDPVEGAVLRIMQPALASGPSQIRLGDVDGCTSTETGKDAVDCALPRLSGEENTEIAVALNAVPEGEVGETVTFRWQLIVPDHYGDKADPDASGELSYNIVPKRADLAITRSTPDQDVQSGQSSDVRLVVANLGPATQPNAVAKIQLGIEVTGGWLQSSDATYVHSAAAEIPSQNGEGNRRVDCTISGNDVSCALGDLAVKESAEIFVTWHTGSVTMGNYHYTAHVGEGIGETSDASLANNRIEGGGEITNAHLDPATD